MTHTIHIRMSAAEWSVTVRPTEGDPLKFDLRSMSRDERYEFHRTFMASYRKLNVPAPKRRRRRRR